MNPLRRLKPWLRWTALAIAVVGAMVVAWYRVDAKARRELAAAKAAFAAHGFPTRIEEIVPPPVPDDENADALLLEAWGILTGSNDWDHGRLSGAAARIDELELYETPTTVGMPAIAAQALTEFVSLAYDPAVVAFAEQVHAASQRSHWRPTLDYEAGPEMMVPQLGRARTMIRILTRRAVALAQSPASIETAWSDLSAAQVLADWTGDIPIIIGALTSHACHGIIQLDVVTVLESGGVTCSLDSVIARRLDYLARTGSQFTQAVHAERITMLNLVDRYLENRGDWIHDFRQIGEMPRWTGWIDPWLTPVLSPLARPRLALETRQNLDLHFRAACELQHASPALIPRLQDLHDEQTRTVTILPDYFFPLLKKLAALHLTHRAKLQAQVVLLATFRHRANNGSWPQHFRELGLPEEIATDPCSGLPLVLRVDSDAVTVYLPGLDGDDDGGRAVDPKDIATGDGDIVVRVRLKR